jgi:hypothetical protein
MVEHDRGQCRHLPLPRQAGPGALHWVVRRWGLFLAMAWALAGCSRVRVLAGPGLDTAGLDPGQIVNAAQLNDWMRYRALRVRLMDGSTSRSGFIRIEGDELVWRPKDWNPFRKAPLRHKPLTEVAALEKRHRGLPMAAGFLAGSCVGLAVAQRDVDFGGDSVIGPVAELFKAIQVLAYMGLGGATVGVGAGAVGVGDRVLLHPTRDQLDRLVREAAWRKEREESP